MPLIGTFPIPPEPGLRANRANEAAGVARTKSTAKAIFTEVFGMRSSTIHENADA